MKFLVAIAFSLVSLPCLADIKGGYAAYEEGDYAKALQEWSTPEAQNDPEVQVYIGYMYENGYGVEASDAAALEWYKKAAAQGNAGGLNNLGILYDTGKGVEQDDKEAMRLYGLAAEQGYAPSQYNLGRMYYFGEGTARDYAKTVNWFRLAAEQKETKALHDLGVLYHDGAGVKKNLVIAYALLAKSVEYGDEVAPETLSLVGKAMKEKDRKAGRALAETMNDENGILAVIDAYAAKSGPGTGKRR